MVITNPAMTMWHHIDGPTTFPSNTAPIVLSFSKIFYRAEVATGTPFFLKCGSPGSVTFSGPGGTVVRPFHQPFPNESPLCSGESQAMTQGGMLTDEVFMPGGMNQITIAPPSPINWQWLCTDSQWCSPGSVPRTVNSSGVVVYGVMWNEQPHYSPTTTSCVTGDPILDLIPARQMLDSLWKLAGGNGPDSLKKEYGGYLFTDSLGIVTFRISVPHPSDNACKNANIPTVPYPGVVIAAMHVHPFGHKEPTTLCHPAVTTLGYNAEAHKSFSSDDLDSRLANDAINFGPALNGMYVMDKKHIAFARVGTNTGNAQQNVVRRTRVNSSAGCQIA
jgi:hypothetical protein